MIEENINQERKEIKEEGSVGALIGSIIIIIILIIGGWYIWQEAKNISNLPPIEKEITIDEVTEIDATFEDSFADIEDDLNAIDLEL